MAQQVGILRETFAGERRVAGTPDTVTRLQKLGFNVVVEAGAGQSAGYADALYAAAGAVIVDASVIWSGADIALKVRPPDERELLRGHRGQVVISFLWPAQNPALVDACKRAGITAIAMDQVPRISRAQKMDALSSMANIAGYRAIIEAAHAFPRLFAGQITAAGKMPPAKVLIIGAGVAGLAAVGAARGLGAVVRAFDTRAAVREQIQSMGAEFIEVTGVAESGEGQGGYAKEMSKAFLDAEMALFRAQAKEVDVVVTTALIPGKPAPKLWLHDMVESMRAGSVVVDLAAEQGGNCELTVPGQSITTANASGGTVTVIGFTDLASRMAAQASQLYGTNLAHLLDDMTRPSVKEGAKDGAAPERHFRIDFDDEVVRAATVTKDGVVTWPPPKREPPPVAAPSATPKYPAEPTPANAANNASTSPASASNASALVSSGNAGALVSSSNASSPKAPAKHGAPAGSGSLWPLLLAGIALVGLGVAAPPAFLAHLIVFVLACFIGYQVIWNVTAALHTPLMSVTNAISGIILVGGLLHASDGAHAHLASTALGGLAILIATINIAGGFLVTQRMLGMFRRGGDK